jgi:hypothetical protein
MYRRCHLMKIRRGSETLTTAADCGLSGRDVRTVFDCRAPWEPHGSMSCLHRSSARRVSEHTLNKSLCSIAVTLSERISMYWYVRVCLYVCTYVSV